MALQRTVMRGWRVFPLLCCARTLGAIGRQEDKLRFSLERWFSTAPAAADASPPAPASTSTSSPTTQDACPDLISGRADSVGTASFAKKIGAGAGPGHFRSLRVGSEAGDLVVSSIGIGTYLGPETDATDQEYIESITRSFCMGINFIDTATSYRHMRSELTVGQALANSIKQGIINRNEVVVCSKAGFLAFDYREDIDPYTYIDEKYVKPELFKREEFVAGCHCLAPAFLKNQVDVSRRNLGLETIDVYYIHNPETQLSECSRVTVLSRMKEAIGALEECVSEGKITMYGVATWNGFRQGHSGRLHVVLEELVKAAKEVGGENHHFKVVQAPYNAALQEAARTATQSLKGKWMPLVHVAHQLGLSVVAAASLNQSALSKNLDPEVRRLSHELGDQQTDAQSALQFVRTTPGIMTALVGMRNVEHVEANASIVKYPANPRAQQQQQTQAATA